MQYLIGLEERLSEMNKKKGTILLFIAAAIGGLGFVLMKNLLDSGFSPIQCVAGRYIFAVAFMCLFYIKELKNITKEELNGGSLMGALLFLLFVMLMEGLKRTTPSVNAFLSCTTAIMVPIILWIGYKKRPDKYVVIGAFMTIFGVAMLSLNEQFEINLGAVLSLGASVMLGMQMVVMDKYVEKCNPARLTIVESVVVMVLSIVSALFSGEAVPKISETDIVMFALAGVLCTFVYFLFISISQKCTSPTTTSIIITSESVFAAFASALFYGETIGLRVVAGGLLIFCAVIIAEAKPNFFTKKELLTNRYK
jgi:drug/metabolite transporter (DMT)-like permease